MLLRKCVLICASPYNDMDFIIQSIPEDAFIVCVDGGHTLAARKHISPQLIIGDFDSSICPSYPDCEFIVLPTHKDDTDTMYAIKTCLSRGFNDFDIYGATGGREDHTFANLCVLQFLSDKNCTARLLDPNTEIVCQNGGTKTYKRSYYSYFSIFPFGCPKAVLTLKGFEYPLEYGILRCDYPLGISNSILGETAEVTVHEGRVIIIQTKES